MSQSDTEDFQSSQPKVYTSRRQYLVTYSKADMSKFPTRDSFGEAVVSCFNTSGKVVVEYIPLATTTMSVWNYPARNDGTQLKRTFQRTMA